MHDDVISFVDFLLHDADADVNIFEREMVKVFKKSYHSDRKIIDFKISTKNKHGFIDICPTFIDDYGNIFNNTLCIIKTEKNQKGIIQFFGIRDRNVVDDAIKKLKQVITSSYRKMKIKKIVECK